MKNTDIMASASALHALLFIINGSGPTYYKCTHRNTYICTYSLQNNQKFGSMPPMPSKVTFSMTFMDLGFFFGLLLMIIFVIVAD